LAQVVALIPSHPSFVPSALWSWAMPHKHSVRASAARAARALRRGFLPRSTPASAPLLAEWVCDLKAETPLMLEVPAALLGRLGRIRDSLIVHARHCGMFGFNVDKPTEVADIAFCRNLAMQDDYDQAMQVHMMSAIAKHLHQVFPARPPPFQVAPSASPSSSSATSPAATAAPSTPSTSRPAADGPSPKKAARTVSFSALAEYKDAGGKFGRVPAYTDDQKIVDVPRGEVVGKTIEAPGQRHVLVPIATEAQVCVGVSQIEYDEHDDYDDLLPPDELPPEGFFLARSSPTDL